ncbi:CbiQ family ECF transporter T component [uncultured Georgenia sp.]|uniref:CbiQ family ECF transporter T component n=1 Tax=uncultured Georgenia sp. TaxID=378209 RepID=UPI00262C34E7|nr:CbiQ family ECF transporter T component [uncultured Georgenia sp.]HLV05713.1 CbiQ family ECF transporter T component [Actinomycetaceae bacterium]
MTTDALAAPPRTTAARPRVRELHPLAWWAWAAGACVAVSRTGNPVGLVLLVAAVVAVVLRCRGTGPWTRVFRVYVAVAVAVVVLRLAFHVLFGLRTGGPVLLPLPRVPLPQWAGGISLLGPVQLPGLLAALYTAAALAAVILCFGAANTLANPKHVLRHLPGALHDLSTSVVIAVTVAPQLVASVRDVRRARRLRGVQATGPRAALQYVQPVLHDAMDRAIALAASMDSRGYAHTRGGASRGVNLALLVSLVLAGLGTYGLLDATVPRWLGAPVLALATVVGGGAAALASRRVRRTRYRPVPWRSRETVVALCGAVAAGIVVTAGAPAHPDPLAWPGLPLGALAAAALLAVPAVTEEHR